MAFDDLREETRNRQALVNSAKRETADPSVIQNLEASLEAAEQKMNEMIGSHVAVTLVEAQSETGRQMFVDIARNAKGVNPDFTVVLDERSVVHRIAAELSNTHPLLKDRVENGHSTRITANSSELVGAKTVADIVRGVIVGAGRVGKRVENDVAKKEDLYTKQVSEFLDALVASFEDLRGIMDGSIKAPELREHPAGLRNNAEGARHRLA